MICQKCLFDNRNGAKFCAHCGNKLEVPVSQDSETASPLPETLVQSEEPNLEMDSVSAPKANTNMAIVKGSILIVLISLIILSLFIRNFPPA